MLQKIFLIVASLSWLQSIGCSKVADDGVIARIDTAEITIEDLRQFRTETPALLRSEKEGIEEWRDYLQTMTDMELIFLEARVRGLDQDPKFLRNWEEERRKKLIQVFLRRKILDEIQLSEEEWRHRFEKSKWSRMLKLAHIRVATEVEARQVTRELEQGRPFEEVARERSMDQEIAFHGGLLVPSVARDPKKTASQRPPSTLVDSFIGRDHLRALGLPMPVAEALFELPVGKVSQPFQIRDGYEIFKAVEERPAPDWYIGVFARVTQEEMFYAQRKELLAELAKEFDVRLDQGTIAFIIEKAADANEDTLHLSEQEREMVLCRFESGQLTLGDFVDTYRQISAFRVVRFDRNGIAEFTEQHLLPGALLYRAALQERVEQDTSVVAWLQAKKKAMLIEALKEQEVEKQIDLSDATVHRYYQTHQDLFMEPEEIQVLEILVETQAKAEEFLQRVRNGADMEVLAGRYSIRKGIESNKGHFHMHPFERPIFGALLDEALATEVGVLKGPVKVGEGYSIFKVLKRTAPCPQPFEKAARRARYWLKSQEEKQLVEALLLKLREKYASKIILFEDRLAMMERDSD